MRVFGTRKWPIELLFLFLYFPKKEAVASGLCLQKPGKSPAPGYYAPINVNPVAGGGGSAGKGQGFDA